MEERSIGRKIRLETDLDEICGHLQLGACTFMFLRGFRMHTASSEFVGAFTSSSLVSSFAFMSESKYFPRVDSQSHYSQPELEGWTMP